MKELIADATYLSFTSQEWKQGQYLRFHRIQRESAYEMMKRISKELPHEITQKEIDEFKRVCEKYYGIASIIPFTLRKEIIDILAEQKAPLIAREYVARIVGLTSPLPARIKSLAEFLSLPQEEQIRICETTMYPLAEAENMKDKDKLLKLALERATTIDGLTGREALRKAYLETCRKRIARYFQILATPSLLIHHPLEVIPRRPGAQIISYMVCETPKPPTPEEKTEEKTKLEREETKTLALEICNLNIKAPYILDIKESLETKTTISRYVNPTIPGAPSVDELRVETELRAEPRVPDEKLEIVREYLARNRPHILREITARARRGEDEKTLLKQTAIAIYLDNLRKTIEEHIKEICKTTIPPIITYRYERLKDAIKGYEHLLPQRKLIEDTEIGRRFIKMMEEVVIPVPQISRRLLEPLCPVTVDITTEEEVAPSHLVTAGWRIVEEMPREVKAKKLKIKITACAEICPVLLCMIEATNPIVLRTLAIDEARKLRFIEL